jgi:membrane protease subunit HflK
MAEHPHTHDELTRREPSAETPMDAGSQALSEALRSSFGIVKFVMFLLVGVFLGSGFFTVGPQERAIKIRLGKPVGEGDKALLMPGLHWSWPYPIEEAVKVPITSIQKVTSSVAWYNTTPEMELAGTEVPSLPVTAPINPLVDGYALTADKNIVHTRATLTYHIDNPIGFVFNFVNASNMVQSALDNSLLSVASEYSIDDILKRDIVGFKEAVLKRVIAQVESQNLGIAVEDCQIQSREPRQLRDAFQSVIDAEVKRGKVLNEARSYEAQVMSKASAESQSRINAAESDRVRLVNDLRSQAERFNELLPRFKENPELFAEQRWSEVVSRILTNAQDKIYITTGPNDKPKELRLLLNREPPKKTAEEPKR